MALTRQEADELLDVGAPDAAEEAAFVAALRAGDPQAFHRLVELHETSLFNVALRVVQDREDARDIVQEVFVKALRAIPSTKGRLHLRAWLYRVTINASYDHLRAARRRPVPVDESESEVVSPIDDIERAELACMFATTLKTLPIRQQVALLLKDVHGLPHREIAEALDISRGSAEVLLFRARRSFRREFQALDEGAESARRCRRAENEVARAVGRGLAPNRRRRLLDHATTCPDCRRTMDKLGGATAGLALAFPLVAMAEGSTAAALGAAASAAGGAAGVAGVATGAAGSAAATSAAAAAGASGASAGGAAAGLFVKLSTLASAKTAAAVVGACAVTAGGVAGVELAIQKSVDGQSDPRPADVEPASPAGGSQTDEGPQTGAPAEGAGLSDAGDAGTGGTAEDPRAEKDAVRGADDTATTTVVGLSARADEREAAAGGVAGELEELSWRQLALDESLIAALKARGVRSVEAVRAMVLRLAELRGARDATLSEAWFLLTGTAPPTWLCEGPADEEPTEEEPADGGDDAEPASGGDGGDADPVGADPVGDDGSCDGAGTGGGEPADEETGGETGDGACGSTGDAGTGDQGVAGGPQDEAPADQSVDPLEGDQPSQSVDGSAPDASGGDGPTGPTGDQEQQTGSAAGSGSEMPADGSVAAAEAEPTAAGEPLGGQTPAAGDGAQPGPDAEAEPPAHVEAAST